MSHLKHLFWLMFFPHVNKQESVGGELDLSGSWLDGMPALDK